MNRVLFVDHVDRILGGAEINLVELLTPPFVREHWTVACAVRPGSRLSQALNEIGISQREYSLPPALSTLRVVGRRFSPIDSIRSLGALRAARQALENVIAEFKPDLVVSCTNKDHFCATSACRRMAVPSVWWVNDILSSDFFPWTARQAFRWRAARGAARLIVVSEYARQAILNGGLPDGLVTTIHNGIPLDRYRKTQRGHLRRQLGLPGDEPLVGHVGRYTAWKGQELFLRCAVEWLRENPRGHFVLIGHAFNEDQPYETALRRFAVEHGIDTRVRFVPFQADVAATLSDLDVLVHSSVRPEPFGRVIIEAMAVETPVIAAGAGGVPEIITHGRDGLLAKPGDVADYLAQMRRILGSAGFAAALGQAGRRTVEQRFGLERARQQWQQVFSEIGALRSADPAGRPVGSAS